MDLAAPSPFLEVPEAEWVCANDLCFAIVDSYPGSPGHVLVITRRVVPTFFACTAAEQGALVALVGEVKALLDERLDPKPDGHNVGFIGGAARVPCMASSQGAEADAVVRIFLREVPRKSRVAHPWG